MRIESKIALRYVFSKKSINYISIISIISIIGIATGVAALIVVLSILNGFREISENQLLEFDPHLRLLPSNSAYIKNYSEIEKKIKTIHNIKAFSAVVSTKIVASKGSNIQVANIVSYLNYAYLESCNFNAKVLRNNKNTMISGVAFADRLNLYLGDTVKLISARMLEKSIQSFQIPNGISLTADVFFQANVKDYDLSLIYANHDILKKLTQNIGENISYIDIKLNNSNDLDVINIKLKKLFSNDIKILTWIDLNQDLYYVMQFERLSTFVVLSLILLIAVFNVFASLVMTIVETKQDVAVLKAVGAKDKFIKKLYMFEGIIIGVIATVSGVILGITFAWGQNTFKFFTLDGEKYIIDAIPLSVNFIEIFFIALFSILLSIIATIYPARKASQAPIIESLRAE